MRTVRRLAFAAVLAGALLTRAAVAQTSDWNYSYIYSFQGPGTGPGGLTAGPQGKLYGTMCCGSGTFSTGSVFELTPPAAPGGTWTMATLYNFQGGSDGEIPQGPLAIGPKGEIYGTTGLGGLATTFCGSSGCGTVYRLMPSATPGGPWTETVLYRFQGPPDAVGPKTGVVIGPDGSLFGATYQGGAYAPPVNGNGTVYQLTPPSVPGGSWTEAVIHSFRQYGPAGCNPMGGVAVSADGVLYGSTSACSIGTIFSLTPPAAPGAPWKISLIRKYGTLGTVFLATDGKLYGTMYDPLFQLTPPSVAGQPWTGLVLYKFVGVSGTGLFSGPIVDASGTVYGTTIKGGKGLRGIIYQVVPPAVSGGAWTENTLYSFASNDFSGPVIFASNGGLYGISAAGQYGLGAVYELTPPSSGAGRH